MTLFVGASTMLLSSSQLQPSDMEANEYLANISRKFTPTNIFRCIHSREELKHHHRIIQLR